MNGLQPMRLIALGLVFCLNILAFVLSQMAAARVLGIEAYGAFSTLYALCAIGSGVAAMGYDFASLRFAPVLEEEERRRFFRHAVRSVIRSSLVVMAIMAAGLWMFYDYGAPAVLAALATVSLWAMVRLVAAFLRATGHFILSQLVDRCCRDGLILALALWLLWSGGAMGAAGLIGPAVLGGALGLTIGLFRLRHNFVRDKEGKHSVDPLWRQASLSLLAVSVLELIYSRLEVIIASQTLSMEAAATVNAINVITNILAIPGIALGIVYLPLVSKAYWQEGRASLNRHVRILSLLVAGSVLPLMVLIMVFPQQFLSLFGGDVAGNVNAADLQIALAGRVVVQLVLAAGILLQMTGKTRGLIISFSFIIAFKLLALFAISSTLGVRGVVLVLAAGSVALAICMFGLMIRLLKEESEARVT